MTRLNPHLLNPHLRHSKMRPHSNFRTLASPFRAEGPKRICTRSMGLQSQPQKIICFYSFCRSDGLHTIRAPQKGPENWCRAKIVKKCQKALRLLGSRAPTGPPEVGPTTTALGGSPPAPSPHCDLKNLRPSFHPHGDPPPPSSRPTSRGTRYEARNFTSLDLRSRWPATE